MGVVKNIKHDAFPRQSDWVGWVTEVAFHYDTEHKVQGRIVRDDMDQPCLTLIELVDGRIVTGAECQWTIPKPPEF